jgi:glycosyltransferase involved in cell wall biosynthesis
MSANDSAVQRPVRVTYFINSLEQGGAERQMAELIRHLDRTRFEPALVLCNATDQLGYALPIAEGRVRHLNAPMFPGPVSVAALARALRELETDVLHSYMGWENIFGRVAARMAGVRAAIGSVRCTELPRKHVLGERLTHSMADAVIVNSVGIRDELVRRAGIPASRIDVIENGVDFGRFRPLDPATIARERNVWGMKDKRVLVVPGRISEQKNQLAILRALALLAKAGELPPDVRVYFAGRGSPPWYGELVRTWATASGIGTHVDFLGIVTRVERLVGAADAMLLPSNYEGLPNAVIEAMSCGVPVIVSPAANTDRLVTDGVEGLTVEGREPAAIARALQRFFALSPEELRAMGGRGHAHAAERFAVARMARRTMDVYERVLSARAPELARSRASESTEHA